MKHNSFPKWIFLVRNQKCYLWLVVALVALSSMGCQSSTQTPPKYKIVTETEYGSEKWPFTVSKGQIECWGDSQMIFRTSEGAYALNGYTSSVYKFTNIGHSTIIKSDQISYGVFSSEFTNFVNEGINFCLEP